MRTRNLGLVFALVFMSVFSRENRLLGWMQCRLLEDVADLNLQCLQYIYSSCKLAPTLLFTAILWKEPPCRIKAFSNEASRAEWIDLPKGEGQAKVSNSERASPTYRHSSGMPSFQGCQLQLCQYLRKGAVACTYWRSIQRQPRSMWVGCYVLHFRGQNWKSADLFWNSNQSPLVAQSRNKWQTLTMNVRR